MKITKACKSTGILIFFCFLFNLNSGYAQLPDLDITESDAKNYFENGNIQKALDIFNSLLESSPQNPEYQYYIGRCLLKLQVNPSEAIDNLRFAAVKGYQTDSWFYLGQAYDNNADFEKAINSYKRFIQNGKRSEIKKTRVNEFLDRAQQELEISGENRSRVKTPATEVNNTVSEQLAENSDSETKITDAEQKENPVQKTETTGPDKMDQPGQFMDKDEIIPSSNSLIKNENPINKDLSEALNLQLQADSLKRESKMKRAQLKEIVNSDDRNSLAREISSLEKESGSLQAKADKLYKEMQFSPSEETKVDTVQNIPDAIQLKEEINGIKVYQYKIENIQNNNKQVDIQKSVKQDKEKYSKHLKEPEDEFTMDNPRVYNISNPIPARRSIPEVLVYYIQLGVYSKKMDDNSFQGFSPVCYDDIPDRGLFKYYAGLFYSFKTANEALSKIRSSGYPDAFIVAFYKNEQIKTDKAQQIEYSQYEF